jgi:hypothetical protein
MVETVTKGAFLVEYKIIFDNGGGVTLQLGEWAHYFSHMATAADSFRWYERHGNTNGWDGYEQEAADLRPTDEEIKNGGYKVYTDVDDVIMNAVNECWGNVRQFAAAYILN